MVLADLAVKNYSSTGTYSSWMTTKSSGESREVREKRLLVVPRELRQEVLRLCRDVPADGHQGLDRTNARLKDRFCWYGMFRDAENYLSTCGPCSRNKRPQRHARAEMLKYHAGAPMERVHLDFLGPLPRSARGNVFVLVMVDQFTKWVECIHLPFQTAEVTATRRAMVSTLLLGAPSRFSWTRGGISRASFSLLSASCSRFTRHVPLRIGRRPTVRFMYPIPGCRSESQSVAGAPGERPAH